MSSYNNFADMGFDCLYAEDGSHIDPDAPIAGPSRSQDWYLNPAPVWYDEQSMYEGSTLLDASGGQFVDLHAGYPDAFGNSEAEENVYSLNTHERTVNMSAAPACPSEGDTFAARPTHDPHPTPTYAAETVPHGAYDQPLAGPPPTSQWSTPHPTTSVDKGKARATDHLPFHPESAGNSAWHYEQPRTVEHYGMPFPHTVPGVPPNTDAPAPIAPSHGPQRSVTDVKGKGRAMPGQKGRRKQDPSDPPPEGIDSSWEETKDRFVWKLLEEYYLRSPGRSINPETAFANINKYIKEDLHRSPLAAQAAKDKRASREYEQYLANVLRVLRRSENGEMENDLEMYTRVLRELESELTPVDARRVLRGHSSVKKDPNELSNSRTKVNHRKAEQGRRTATRHFLDQISAFFLVQGQKKVSLGKLLLFVVIYLRIGEIAFPGLINVHSPGRRQ